MRFIKKAFDDVKAIIAKDVVLAYPDYSMEFETYTNALSKQLGLVITQGNCPLAFFIMKSTTQQKYSGTTEHSEDSKRVQRHGLGAKTGAKTESLYRPQKSNPRCPWADFRPHLLLEVAGSSLRNSALKLCT
jgi:hypothetical protein